MQMKAKACSVKHRLLSQFMQLERGERAVKVHRQMHPEIMAFSNPTHGWYTIWVMRCLVDTLVSQLVVLLSFLGYKERQNVTRRSG